MAFLQQQGVSGSVGSLDGESAGDHDQPYSFGLTSQAARLASGARRWRPRVSELYQRVLLERGFNTRLLVFRGRLQDHLTDNGDADGTSLPQTAA
jgi:hypothetical protein